MPAATGKKAVEAAPRASSIEASLAVLYNDSMEARLPASIETSLSILRTHRWMRGDTNHGRGMEQTIRAVIEAFEATGARWAVVGAHAVGIFTQPRATEDFDFVVEESKLKAILARLESALGDLQLEDIGAAVRSRALNVDLIRSTAHPVFQAAVERSTAHEGWWIPSPEVLIVLKFLSSVSPWRGRERRAQDTVDLVSLYRAVGREALDVGLMTSLAATVYPRAEREFEDLLDRIDHNEPISI